MDALTLSLFILGFVFLVVGADLLVRGASTLAMSTGISPLVVGLTVVAFGTSAPELAISIQSALDGKADLAVGNVIGSNIANVLLILGIAALIMPITVSRQIVRLDVPLMLMASILLYLLCLDGVLGFLDGIIMVIGVIAYVSFSIIKSRRSYAKEQANFAEETGLDTSKKSGGLLQLVWIGLGLILLILGAMWLVDGAVIIARLFGLSELIIGLTIIAIGTSLPEIAAAVIASLRHQQDLVVGNVVGSNLFNILLVLGFTATIAPNGIPIPAAALSFDMPIMIAAAFACVPIFFTQFEISRQEGTVFLLYYLSYLSYLIFNATQHSLLPLFSHTMLWFVLPFTLIAFAFFVYKARQQKPS